MDRQLHWQNVYQSRNEDEVSWFQSWPIYSLELIDRVGCGVVIDVGGGASRLAEALLERGVRLTILDIAEAALDKSRARLGEQADAVEWVAADITKWRPEASCDLWHDRALFHFLIEPAERGAYAETMAAAVEPGGHAVIATFAPDGPERCSGLPVCRYDANALALEFAPHFQLIDEVREAHVTPAGKLQSFQYCLLRRV